ncbi:hypothetical protein K0M31_004577 [Melipona bicolor]|uniref:Uncharacterized protein n=1 Tax=Melipona bicolor TaxID=60889 RepID=A0AA40FX18_9HYME|nr:hypothetical protein K0M31_004577 [Melipona bicolor]
MYMKNAYHSEIRRPNDISENSGEELPGGGQYFRQNRCRTIITQVVEPRDACGRYTMQMFRWSGSVGQKENAWIIVEGQGGLSIEDDHNDDDDGEKDDDDDEEEEEEEGKGRRRGRRKRNGRVRWSTSKRRTRRRCASVDG